jgi:hypothetical protein
MGAREWLLMSEIHDRHVEQLRLEANDLNKQVEIWNQKMAEATSARDDYAARAAETERLLAHLKEAPSD